MANTKPNTAQITYQAAGTGSVVRTVDSKLGESVSVFDFMTPAEIADVKALTAQKNWAEALDCTTAINNAIAAQPLQGSPNWASFVLIFPPVLIR